MIDKDILRVVIPISAIWIATILLAYIAYRCLA